MSQLIVFSDIDGTLIDFNTYSVAAAVSAVAALRARGVPLVLCSSKTRVEQEALRAELALSDPFIVENGSAIFVPEGLFAFELPARSLGDGWLVVELGCRAETIRAALVAVRTQTGVAFDGYADLTTAEVAAITGLDEAAAKRAQQREYSETIVTPLSAETFAILQQALAVHGLSIVSGGKFHTVMGADSDKGSAVARLTAFYERALGAVETLGLGDSANDEPLLSAVDRAFLVQKPGGVWQTLSDSAEVVHVEAVGPLGWRQVIEQELARLG